VTAKPTVSGLGIDPGAQSWWRSGEGEGAIEIAFARGWVLMRVAGDPDGRVLVFDRHEWECFLDGARNGEFDAREPGTREPGAGEPGTGEPGGAASP
jgi:Domain of unknown function (DUF397)